MIRLRLATEAGIQEITPASLTHCAGCEQEYYLDGPADPDPHFCCEVYDRRTDRRRLPECIRATNTVNIELMRQSAERNFHLDDVHAVRGAYDSYDVAFPVHEPRPPLIEFDPSAPIVRRTLRFHVTRCECNEHGRFTALLLRGEKPFCPYCIASWEEDMRRMLASILQHARRWSELADIIDPYLPPERVLDLVRWLPRLPTETFSWTPTNPIKLLH